MKAFTRWMLLLLTLALLAGCGTGPGVGPARETATRPGPQVYVTPAPSAATAADLFVQAWRAGDYYGLYDRIDAASRATISADDFFARYQDVMSTLALYDMTYEIYDVYTTPTSAEASVRVTFRTALLGDLTREYRYRFTLEDGAWKLAWDDGLIMPELRGGNRLAINYVLPERGNIYDRNGNVLVSQTNAYALGVVPGQIIPEQEDYLLSVLSDLTGIRRNNIKELYQNAAPGWYVPIGEVSADVLRRREGEVAALAGVVYTPYNARFYEGNGLAAQTIGYTKYISPEELATYRRQGYSGAEKVGASGIEEWGEKYLGGRRGGTLYLIGPQGQILQNLGSVSSAPASSIYLTIDKNLQYQTQQALVGFQGAAVVIEMKTGRVLAIASSPGFDPNFFEPANRNNVGLTTLFNSNRQPLFNRAAEGTYPLGSVFKVVTYATALESGVYLPTDTYDCQYTFTELPDRTLYDWTYAKCQEEIRNTGECKTKPSGLLTLPEGLMRSCNPWFYHIGLDLYSRGLRTAVTDMALAFGLGRETGIPEIVEAAGQVLPPGDGVQATNQAIGQGDVLVTPLQVARMIAAIGNGGTLYTPGLVERIQPPTGDPTYVFRPQASGTLPLKPETLASLQTALRSVVTNSRGTAYVRMLGLSIPTAGKTGTAETGRPGFEHAWYAGYTLQDDPNKPDIAVAVIVEFAGQGSDYAAPIFRRIVESYFFGQPRALYWFESNYGVTRTPTPLGGIPTPNP